ncbi:hypothetical protein [Streptomyces sp. HC307]|uniref:hypothetical protein n=1 Tax=Streptomyces flavusporus TaxID=3385496 RepID=UPI003916E20E
MDGTPRGFFINPAVNSRVFGILGETRTLGGAVNIAAFNLGIAVAPWVGGLLIDAGFGLEVTAWVGAAFAVAALGSTLLDRFLTRRHEAADPGYGRTVVSSRSEEVTAAHR